jgi:hypothetical protein
MKPKIKNKKGRKEKTKKHKQYDGKNKNEVKN